MAMNPVIKFTTLFGLLAVEIAVTMKIRPRRPVSARSSLWWRWCLSIARSTACGFPKTSKASPVNASINQPEQPAGLLRPELFQVSPASFN